MRNDGANVTKYIRVAVEKRGERCNCKECCYPSCHDPVWRESYCQYHYNEEHYLSR